MVRVDTDIVNRG